MMPNCVIFFFFRIPRVGLNQCSVVVMGVLARSRAGEIMGWCIGQSCRCYLVQPGMRTICHRRWIDAGIDVVLASCDVEWIVSSVLHRVSKSSLQHPHCNCRDARKIMSTAVPVTVTSSTLKLTGT